MSKGGNSGFSHLLHHGFFSNFLSLGVLRQVESRRNLPVDKTTATRISENVDCASYDSVESASRLPIRT